MRNLVVGPRWVGVRMLGQRATKALGGIGLAVAIACAYPLVRNVLVSVPPSEVTVCKVTFSHNYFVYVTLRSGQSLLLDRLDVPDPAKCLAPGTVVEKQAGELGFRINGARNVWHSKAAREYALFAIAGFLAAAVALASFLRRRRAA